MLKRSHGANLLAAAALAAGAVLTTAAGALASTTVQDLVVSPAPHHRVGPPRLVVRHAPAGRPVLLLSDASQAAPTRR